jgi:hypothetical protein
MSDILDSCIGTPHWEACETCINNVRGHGCCLTGDINLSLHLGDFILCDDYEKDD